MSYLSRGASWLAAMLIIAALVPATSSAQVTRGSIAGIVRDASGAVVPGATVTVSNMDTNATQVVQTDAQGFYRVAALEPGRYQVVAELSGFTRVEQNEIPVRSATETPIDVKLNPAGIGELVTVTAESTTVGLNKANPTIGFATNARTVVELPLAGGRNINNLVLTVPNAMSTTGQGTYAVNGQRPRNNNYMVDGSDNNDISVTIATSVIVPEAVAEFQVLQNPYSVEFGRNSGGQINVITKSGTNSFSGEAWDYYQSNDLNSLTNTEKAAKLTKPAHFRRHQMGGDLGGPVMRNKAFFFGLFQRDQQRPGARPVTTAVRILTPSGFAALQSLPLRAGQSAASRQAVLERLSFLQDLYSQNLSFQNVSTSLVNGLGIETGQANPSIVDPSTYNSYLGRGDFRPISSDNFTFRYSLNDRVDKNAISNCAFGSVFCGNQDLVDTNVAASNAHVFRAGMLNEFRFSLVRRNLDFPENDPKSPTATISGLFTVGGSSNFPQSRVTDAYQFADTLTRTLSKHTLKFGADIRYNKADNQSAFDTKGTYTFNSLQDFLNNNAFRLTQALQTASWKAKQWQTFWFAQDDYRVTSDLTLNLGLRYELSTVPFGMFGATDAQSLGALVPGPVKRDTNNWAPRAGFAWSPRTGNALLGDGKTVFRGGFGMGYDVLFYNLLTVNASNYPRVVVADLFNVVDVYPGLIPATATPVFDPLASYTNSAENTESPESRFYSFTVQREVGRYLFEVGYSGSHSYKGINQILMNPAILTPEQAALVAATKSSAGIPAVQARRIFPQFGIRTVIPAYVGPSGNDVEARSTYNAVFFSASRRLANGVQINASYTFSKWMSNNDASLGEGGTGQSSQRPQNMFDYGAEWSRSQYDRPHRFTSSYLWEIPGPKKGVLRQIIGGWQLSGVTQAQSGQPFTILTGVDSSGDSNTGSDRPNINSSGTFVWDKDHKVFTNNGYYVVPLGTNNLPLANSLGNGNAPRNSERAKGYWNTDMSLMKHFSLGGNRRLMVRADALNVFNQDNYLSPVNTMTSASFGQSTGNFGRRIIQLSGKVSF